MRAVFAIAITMSGTACLQPPNVGQGASRSAAISADASVPLLEPAAGPRAAKIVFRANAVGATQPNGSFDLPSNGAAGTPATPGSGHPALRIFNPDGSLLASRPLGGSPSANWPAWISSVEIGLTGSATQTSPDCARFATATEATTALCDSTPGVDGTGDFNCGASDGMLRVSEFDCSRTGLAGNPDGNGGPGDEVYIRVLFNRSSTALNPYENVLAVLEYTASSMHPAPANPTSCFSGGVFDPRAAGCSDQVWNIFLKHGVSDVYQPFLMLVPPALAHVDGARGLSGAGVGTKQFYIPLSADPNLTVLQISRIKGLPNATQNFALTCNPGGTGSANSALCVGMVFHSLTFFRI